MALIKDLIMCVNMAVVVALLSDGSDEVVSSDCLQCLCEGPSGCDLDLSCDKRGGYFCGPFKISWAYWADAGKPKVRGDDPDSNAGFISCAKDMYCAAETVRRYMKHFARRPDGDPDCNKDGTVDCEDFAKMHRLGGYACHQIDDGAPEFYGRFNSCWSAKQKKKMD